MFGQFLAWDTGVGGALKTALETIFQTLVSPLVAVLKVLLSILAEIVYYLISDTLINILYVLLKIVDFCEGIFNIFAGVEPVNAYGEEMYLLDAFISHNTIQNALVMITIVAVIVCFVFTLYSLGKSIGANIVENKKPVGHIMGQALKACIAFLLVPLMCYFGVQLSSTLLTSTSRAITTAMGSDESTPFSTVLFLSGTFGGDSSDSYSEGARADYLSNKKSIYNRSDITLDFPMKDFDNQSDVFESMFAVDGSSQPEYYEAGLGSYNYILVYCEAIFTIIVMLCSVLVFIRRIIEVIMLYIVSPFFVASIPLDEGGTFKRWREMFIGKLISGFGTVFTLKIVLLLVPVFMSSSFTFAEDRMVDAIIKTIFAVGSIFAAYKSQHTILEAFNPEIAQAAKESAGAVMALGAAAVKVGVQAASAVATGGASAAASAAGGLAGAAGAAGSAAGAAGGLAGAAGGAAGGLGGAAGGLGGAAGGAGGAAGSAGGGAFTGGGSAGGLNTGGASAGSSGGGSSGGSGGGSKGGGLGDTMNKISDIKDKLPSSGDKDKKDESQEYKG